MSSHKGVGSAEPTRRITLQFLADHLGVSKFAVSRALAGKPGVSEETRRSVVRAAEEFGYPARTRTRAATRPIEMIFHDRDVANSELWIGVQHGVQTEAARAGHSTSVRWAQNHGILTELERETAGFILAGRNEPAMIEAARTCRVPSVQIGGDVPLLEQIDRVGATDREAGAFIGSYLAGLEHRCVVYAHGQPGLSGRIDRLVGFRDTLDTLRGAEIHEIAFSETDGGESFRQAFLDMVDKGIEPTAFFCGNDGVAVTVVSELMRLGLRVPDDISVVGYADYACATQISPNLTTIRMPSREMGVAGVRLLLSRINHPLGIDVLSAQTVLLVTTFVERQSTAKANPASWRGRLRQT